MPTYQTEQTDSNANISDRTDRQQYQHIRQNRPTAMPTYQTEQTDSNTNISDSRQQRRTNSNANISDRTDRQQCQHIRQNRPTAIPTYQTAAGKDQQLAIHVTSVDANPNWRNSELTVVHFVGASELADGASLFRPQNCQPAFQTTVLSAR
jgi:hypothetical protein